MDLREFLDAETKHLMTGVRTDLSDDAQVNPVDRTAVHQRAVVHMCRVMFNLNEFVYSD